MENFELPTNVKQIGSIEKGLRVYVEDYVFTFVQGYAQDGGNKERLMVLAGRYLTIDSLPVLFISGAIEGRYCIEERGAMEFSEKSDEYILDTIDQYFPNLEIVGWVQSQPGYGTYLSSKYYNYHIENFKKEFQVLFVTDPIQRINTFYAYNENSELIESPGYFVYYEKNKAMHEYMIDCKNPSPDAGVMPFLVSKKSDTENLEILPKKSKLKDKSQDKAKDKPKDKGKEKSPNEETPRTILLQQAAPKTSGVSSVRKYTPRTHSGVDQKRLVNMLAGLCAVMFLVSFVLGAGLIKSDDRINVLEQNLSALNTAYRDLTLAVEPALSAFSPDNTANEGGQNQVSAVVLTEDGNRLLEEENARASLLQASTEATAPTVAEGSTITVSASNNQAADVPESYTVSQGDSLIGISRKIYGDSAMVEKIMEANNLSNPDKIFLGQVLIMPKP